MSKGKHTSGPLKASVSSDAIGAHWFVYASKAPEGKRLVAECFGPDAEANARLIAAAPALLEAAQRLIASIVAEEHQDTLSGVNELRAAIAQALPEGSDDA